MSLFSIIIPVFNVELYLEEAVQSVLSQSCGDFELILVDDGSNDGSAAICDHYAAADPRVKVIHQENQGVASARNTGLDAAAGDYVIFIDGDDLMAEGRLENLKQVIATGRFAPDLVFGRLCRFEESKERAYPFKCQYDVNAMEGMQPSALRKYLIQELTILSFSVWSHSYRRAFLKENNLYFDPDLMIAEDNDWMIKVLLSIVRSTATGFCTYLHRLDSRTSISSKPMTFDKYVSLHSFRVKWLNYSLGKSGEPAERQMWLHFFSKGYVDAATGIFSIEDSKERKRALALFAGHSHVIRHISLLRYRIFYPVKLLFGSSNYLRLISLAQKAHAKGRARRAASH